ncbi:MAG: DUF58 domain-containing protein [Bacteroidetes bacterium]|nr:MAG: DUF58 domain-containing protein [Bacteroidota bacterium]PTM08670.1 MAG: DUF58 domain-containing protein [Bacteroidota bacterium]
MPEILKNSYLSNRFFWTLGGVVVLFVAGFWWYPLFLLAQVAVLAFVVLVIIDGALLFGRPYRFRIRRKLPRVLSLGDTTRVVIELQNRNALRLRIGVIDELPAQLQVRDFYRELLLAPEETATLEYEIRPTQRGAYSFGHIILFLATPLGLLERRFVKEAAAELPVYPSIIQMKQFELRAFERISQPGGIKQMRRIGHSYEFDQIKNYVRGDDYRSVNWKATGRRGQLMVNQYEDERAQQIYCLIDKSRVMRMPFDDLTLMDHAINTSLVLSNIALKKHDRAGLLTFSDKIGAVLKADSKAAQLSKILQTLYKEQERTTEANYELLYYFARKLISGRSLLVLFTNFESMYALDRVLPILRRISAFHLLVVVFFENTTIGDFVNEPATSVEGIYQQTIARKFLAEKSAMVQKLRQYGIQAVLTRPEDLSMNTINKYLELKARGLI